MTVHRPLLRALATQFPLGLYAQWAPGLALSGAACWRNRLGACTRQSDSKPRAGAEFQVHPEDRSFEPHFIVSAT